MQGRPPGQSYLRRWRGNRGREIFPKITSIICQNIYVKNTLPFNIFLDVFINSESDSRHAFIEMIPFLINFRIRELIYMPEILWYLREDTDPVSLSCLSRLLTAPRWSKPETWLLLRIKVAWDTWIEATRAEPNHLSRIHPVLWVRSMYRGCRSPPDKLTNWCSRNHHQPASPVSAGLKQPGFHSGGILGQCEC